MGGEERLGALAVRKGFASENEVETALDLQRSLEPSADRPAAKVGEILVEMGALTADMLKVLLEEQEALRRRAGDEAPTQTDLPAVAELRLIVRSAVPLSVNGAPVLTTTAVKGGDILKIGTAILQVEGALTIVPSSEAPPEPPPRPAPRAGAKAVASSVLDKVTGLGTRFFKKKDASGTDLPAPAGPGLGAKLIGAAAATGATVKKLIKEAAKKKWAKDRLAANRRRDELLVEIARAAMRMGKIDGPELESARAALKTLDQAEHSTSLRGSAATMEEASQQRQAIKAARDRVEHALVKLGYLVLQKGPEPPGTAAQIREVREIDDALAEAP
jgi:hypothetical protein